MLSEDNTGIRCRRDSVRSRPAPGSRALLCPLLRDPAYKGSRPGRYRAEAGAGAPPPREAPLAALEEAKARESQGSAAP